MEGLSSFLRNPTCAAVPLHREEKLYGQRPDAMDLLHDGTVAGFCIVSSDSDYTRLATRIREQGLFVMGIGRLDTPKSFVNACEVFVYTENLSPDEERDSKAS